MATGSFDQGNRFVSLDHASFASPSTQSENQSLDLTDRDDLPIMPDISIDDQIPDEHVAFRFLGAPPSDTDPADWSPWVPSNLVDLDGLVSVCPMVVVPSADREESEEVLPFLDLMARACEVAGQQTPIRILVQNQQFLSAIAADLIPTDQAAIPLSGLISEVWSACRQRIDLSAAGQAELEQEIAAVADQLPEQAIVFGCHSDAPSALLVVAATQHRRRLRDRIAGRLGHLLRRLDARLEMDRNLTPEARGANHIQAGMGGMADQFVNASTMSELMTTQKGSLPLEPDRRARLQQARDAIHAYLNAYPLTPEILIFHRTPSVIPSIGARVQTTCVDDVLTAAQKAFQSHAIDWIRVCRAVRVADLELDDAYQIHLHDAMLDRLEWTGLSDEERLALPHIVAMEDGIHVQSGGLAALIGVIQSDAQVTIVVRESSAATVTGHLGTVSGAADFACLAMGHQSAYVARSSVGHPSHLFQAIVASSRKPQPSVLVVDCPDSDVAWPQALATLRAAMWARILPLFEFDPMAGSTWSDRFSVAGNPQEDAAWVNIDMPYRTAAGQQCHMKDAFSPAHFAAACPSFQHHFRLISKESWTQYHIALAEFLAQSADTDMPEKQFPYIWVRDAEGNLGRALVTQALVDLCTRMQRSWRTLQELAGIHNAYAIAAEEKARAEASAEADARIQETESEFQARLDEVRATIGRETMERLAAVLLDLDALPMHSMPSAIPHPVPPASDQVVAAPGPSPDEPKAAVAVPAADEAEEELVEEAFIDSALCTTCNECINLNPQMFQYNADKQAEIVDPQAGTFAQLVAAAEKCPARCIHPGAPRPDDATATPELIEKAAKYN